MGGIKPILESEQHLMFPRAVPVLSVSRQCFPKEAIVSAADFLFLSISLGETAHHINRSISTMYKGKCKGTA